MLSWTIFRLRVGPLAGRRKAAVKLGSVRRDRAVRVLVDVLARYWLPEELRSEAEASLVKIGALSTVPLLNFIRASAHLPQSASNLAAVRALVRIGEGSIPALIDSLGDREARVRIAAEDALTQIGDLAIPALLTALSTTDSPSRSGVVRVLGKIGDPKAVDALVLLLDGNLACEAIRSLGQIRDPKCTDALIKVAHDNRSLNRGIAVEALVRLRDARAIEALTQILTKDEAPYLQKDVAWALGAIGDPAAVEALSGVLGKTQDHLLRFAAVSALGRIGSPLAAPVLCDVLSSAADYEVRTAAAQALGAVGPQSSVAALSVRVLISVLNDENVRGAAVQSLRRLGDASAVRPLRDLRALLIEPYDEVVHNPGGPSSDGYYWYEPSEQTIHHDPDGGLRDEIDQTLEQLSAS